MSELRQYATANPPPKDSAETLATADNLSALNIFERTLLGTKTHIFRPNGKGMLRLEKVFSYFREWQKSL